MIAPLEPYATEFLRELGRQGYTAHSASNQLQLIAHASRWLASRGLDVGDLTPARVEQFLEARRALRTETTINDTKDFYANKAIRNLGYLRSIAEAANQKLLQTERLSHDCWISEPAFERLHRPTLHQGQRCPALRTTDTRVRALLEALCGFAHLPGGFRHRDLRPRVAALLGEPTYSANQMTYDLRRLRRKGLIVRVKVVTAR